MAIFWQPQRALGACVLETRRVQHRDQWPVDTEDFYSRWDCFRGKEACTCVWGCLGVDVGREAESCHVAEKGSRAVSEAGITI